MPYVLAIPLAVLWGMIWLGVLIGTFGLFGIIAWALAAVSLFHYRRARQLESLWLLHTLVQANLPLPEGIRAYLRDRPSDRVRYLWEAMCWLVLLPGYRILWARKRGMDDRLASVADLLERGCKLSVALQQVGGVVPQTALLAISVGESTGQLAYCIDLALTGLRTDRRATIATALAYPWLTICVTVLVSMPLVAFCVIFIMPKMQSILVDFQVPTPWVYQALDSACAVLFGNPHIFLLFVILLLISGWQIWRRRMLWHIPLFGQVYRMYSRGWVLRLLGFTCRCGQTIDQGLEFIAQAGVSSALLTRIEQARERLALGYDVPEALTESDLLPPHMKALLTTAQRTNSMPWALEQLGLSLINASRQRLERILIFAYPAVLLLLAASVAFFAIGLFMPLVTMIRCLA